MTQTGVWRSVSGSSNTSTKPLLLLQVMDDDAVQLTVRLWALLHYEIELVQVGAEDDGPTIEEIST